MKYLHDLGGSVVPGTDCPTQASTPVNYYVGGQVFSLTLDWPHSLEHSLHETLNTQWEEVLENMGAEDQIKATMVHNSPPAFLSPWHLRGIEF